MKSKLLIIIILIGVVSCENQPNDFPDYDYTAVYFPYQYPVRTLVLGNYIFDNTNDNNHKFLVSATFGGVYENNRNREVIIEPAPELCDDALFESTGEPIRLLPSEYYTLSSSSTIIIPSGEMSGSVEVQLTDAFFDDPLAIQLAYVLPLRIVESSDIDSVLSGKSSLLSPDPRISGDWEVLPKNFTMFAVNFINPYHGIYLHRGKSTVSDGLGDVVETNVYRTTYIVDNELWSLKTTGRRQVSVQAFTHSQLVPGNLGMVLTFTDNGDCVITESEGSAFTVTGTGKFVENADTWGDKDRDAIHLNYTLTSGDYTYSAVDTLVIRDRDVKMQLYSPSVIPD
jgi:hypothetical protein